MPEIQRRTAQERAADQLAELLESTAGELARRSPRRPSTAVSQNVVDAVTLLLSLRETIQDVPEFCRRAVLGEVSVEEWRILAGVSAGVTQACRACADVAMVVEQQRPMPFSNSGP